MRFHDAGTGRSWITKLPTHVVAVSSPSNGLKLRLTRIGHDRGGFEPRAAVTSDVEGEERPEAVLLEKDGAGELFAITGSVVDSHALVLNDGQWQVTRLSPLSFFSCYSRFALYCRLFHPR